MKVLLVLAFVGVAFAAAEGKAIIVFLHVWFNFLIPETEKNLLFRTDKAKTLFESSDVI